MEALDRLVRSLAALATGRSVTDAIRVSRRTAPPLIVAEISGLTEISAFDNALYNAGIANFNLITLSSVIQPASQPATKIETVERLDWNNKGFGDQLYCVMARKSVKTFGGQAWAGLGWVRSSDGPGLFVEHHADNEQVVHKLIDNPLSDMVRYRSQSFGPVHSHVIGIECVLISQFARLSSPATRRKAGSLGTWRVKIC